MKNSFLKLTYVLIVSAALTISCKEKESENADNSVEQETTVIDNSQVIDTESVNSASGIDNQTIENSVDGSQTSSQTSPKTTESKNSNGSKKLESEDKITVNNSVKTKSKKSKSGYSAADGTDAENRDGDMYTKNDTTPKPSGSTSIK